MIVFSSLEAAMRCGFRWYSFSESENLHVVEIDRATSRGRRVKALAFAVPDADEKTSPARSGCGSPFGTAA